EHLSKASLALVYGGYGLGLALGAMLWRRSGRRNGNQCKAEGLSVPFYVYALILHGLIGGLDVFVNHEWLARLPQQPQAAEEEGLHSAREWIFCALFGSLAWCEWHGASAWWIAALLLGEVLVSARDVVVEGNTRVLPRP